MGTNPQKFELRLCEHLRVHAPQIFNRTQPPMVSAAAHAAPAKNMPPYNIVANPNYPAEAVYNPQVPPAGPASTPVNEPPVALPSHATKNIVWQGKLARNGKKLTDALAVAISGQCTTVLNEKLDIVNITHRLKWEEASKNTPIAVFYLSSVNQTNVEAFDEYISYFKGKNRIGVAPIGTEYNIYVCAPGNPLFNKHAPNDVNTAILVGIVTCVTSTTSGTAASKSGATGTSGEKSGDWLNQLSTLTAMLGGKK